MRTEMIPYGDSFVKILPTPLELSSSSGPRALSTLGRQCWDVLLDPGSRTGKIVKSGTYCRDLVVWKKNHPAVVTIRIQRLLVKGKKRRTIIVLSSCVVAYGRYSLDFIARVLSEYRLHRRTVEQLCEKYEISVTTLYRWKKLYLLDALRWVKNYLLQRYSASRRSQYINKAAAQQSAPSADPDFYCLLSMVSTVNRDIFPNTHQMSASTQNGNSDFSPPAL